MKMSLARALKERSRLAGKLKRAFEIINKENSVIAGSERSFDLKAVFAECRELHDKLVTLKRAIVYWESKPSKFTVETDDGSGWKKFSEIVPAGNVTVVDLAKAGKIAKIRFVQKAGDGGTGRPELMWVREIEIYK